MTSNQCQPSRTHAERTAMLDSVKPLVRKIVGEFRIPKGEREDAFQECMLHVWKVTEKFDPSRGAQWTTYVGGAVRVALKNFNGPRKLRGIRITQTDSGSVDHFGSEDEAKHDIDDDFGPVDQYLANEIANDAGNEAIKRLAETVYEVNPLTPLMAVLTAYEQRIFTLVAIEGLSAVEVSERMCYKLSIIEISIRGIVKKFMDKQLLSPELIAKFQRWKNLDAHNPARKTGHYSSKGPCVPRNARPQSANA